MIAGHLGLAIGARAVDPDAPLPLVVVAALAPDIADFALAAAGVCNADGAYTHSLAAVAAMAIVLAAAAWWRTRRSRTALVAAGLVVSHLLVDYVTGLKVLWVGGPLVGLNLYQWPLADLALEWAVLAGGWYAGRRWGRLPHRLGSRAALVTLLALQFVFDAVSRPSTTSAPSVCAKADLIERLQRAF